MREAPWTLVVVLPEPAFASMSKEQVSCSIESKIASWSGDGLVIPFRCLLGQIALPLFSRTLHRLRRREYRLCRLHFPPFCFGIEERRMTIYRRNSLAQ